MTAVDHAELKRVEGDAVEPIERAIKALKRDIAAIQDAKKRGGSGASLTDCINRLPEIVRWLESGLFEVEAAFEQYEDAADALLSEIEGLKAEREGDWQATIDRIVPAIAPMTEEEEERYHCEAVMWRDRDRIRRELAALRTQAPNSWRPDRLLRAIADAPQPREASGKFLAAVASVNAYVAELNARAALRPQTAESGK